MKHLLCLIVIFLSLPAVGAQSIGIYEQGTVVRMKMGDCPPTVHGFMANFGAPAMQMGVEACPEFTLISDKVVYIIVGRSSNQLIPLADVIDFRLHNNEVAVRLDDSKHESKFSIKEMILRSEWDRIQRHIDEQMNSTELQQARR
jgi:hypothetical protein